MLELQAEALAGERGSRPIFSNLSFSLHGGELGLVIGGNGLGKTTLLRLLSGLLPAATGQVHIKNNVASGQTETENNTIILSGDVPALHQDLTVTENLFWLLGDEINVKENADLLSNAQVDHLLIRRVSQLSRGQKQRVALVRVALSKKPIWLLDEPFAHLDAEGRQWFTDCLQNHLQQQGIAVMTAHHYPDELRSLNTVTEIQLKADAA
ncbi:MAG: heme ABC exporter ATP-binding protein CcmA [Gammaproteobacteria bacterium]|nr:heme ABC exporter ATP-binding protein CcmA [Gammaproteobacteria bacterium]